MSCELWHATETACIRHISTAQMEVYRGLEVKFYSLYILTQRWPLGFDDKIPPLHQFHK
jgi:hypothetical protein